jgi:DNA modification methylase
MQVATRASPAPACHAFDKARAQHCHRSALLLEPAARGLRTTQKPVRLLEYLVRTYSNPGDLVLDPFGGSGGTAVAALKTGRRAISVEKDPEYHARALARVGEVLNGAAPRSSAERELANTALLRDVGVT